MNFFLPNRDTLHFVVRCLFVACSLLVFIHPLQFNAIECIPPSRQHNIVACLKVATSFASIPTTNIKMNYVLWTALSLSLLVYCEAFHPAPVAIPFSAATAAGNSYSRTRLHGIIEWREQALESKYTLEVYQQASSSPVLATIPILPFPFSDVLLQGQRTQLNLFEQRFHELFQDAMDNHCGMVGMGLLAGNGMITTLPICEVESFSRFGAEEDWVDRRDGMGNGSIFVSIRAVGRAKIAESELLQEAPYMKAKVIELLDEDLSMNANSGLKEKGTNNLSGESSPLEIASLVAGNIENMMLSLASMEHRLREVKEMETEKNYKTDERAKDDTSDGVEESNEDPDEVMNRRIVNARLVRVDLNVQCKPAMTLLTDEAYIFLHF